MASNTKTKPPHTSFRSDALTGAPLDVHPGMVVMRVQEYNPNRLDEHEHHVRTFCPRKIHSQSVTHQSSIGHLGAPDFSRDFWQYFRKVHLRSTLSRAPKPLRLPLSPYADARLDFAYRFWWTPRWAEAVLSAAFPVEDVDLVLRVERDNTPLANIAPDMTKDQYLSVMGPMRKFCRAQLAERGV